jgi:hypothetical protein
MNDIGNDMESNDINISKLIKSLLIQWLDKNDFLTEKDKNILFELGCKCLGNTAPLYILNKAVIERQEILTDENDGLMLKAEDGTNTLIYGDKVVEFTEKQLRRTLSGMIDILEEIQPLGTVADLKKEYMQNHIPVNEIENIRVVITDRFLYREDDTAYFPYAGVVYPVGMFDNNKIHFTPAMIEKVVYKGFSDRQDETYIYLMKQELILEKSMHSYGFSTEEERDILKKRIETERVDKK